MYVSQNATPAYGADSPGQIPAAELVHDARNLISALDLYCELLAGPGVLAPSYRHYADDLRAVGRTGARLIEALAGDPAPPAAARAAGYRELPPLRRRPFPGIEDLAAELTALEAPLQALAGTGIRLEVECSPCPGLLGLNAEDLLRILFNLVANAAEAMAQSPIQAPIPSAVQPGVEPAPPPRRCFLKITAQSGGGASFLAHRAGHDLGTVVLSVRDNGPGIAAGDLGRIFSPGFSTRATSASGRPTSGLGLPIVRRLVESAGGAVRAVSVPGLGARFDIEIPILAERAGARPDSIGDGRPSATVGLDGPEPARTGDCALANIRPNKID